ncbi:MAG: mechanosensitive ion channel [Blastomonas sp.]
MTDPQSATFAEFSMQSLSMNRLEAGFDTMWQWLLDHTAEIVVALVAGTVLHWILRFLASRAALFAARQPDRLSLPAIVGRTLAKTGHFFILMVSAKLIIAFAYAPEGLARVINFLFTVSVALQVAIWVREIILGVIERRATDDEGGTSDTLVNAMALIRILVTSALFIIASIVILDNLGVDVTGLVAGLGIGGIAIGLAAQGIFSDLFAALSIIFDKPFRRGETIGFDNMTATVEKIGLKSARLRSVFGEEIIISNANLLNKEIVNYTRLDRRRTRYGIGVIYQTAPEDARRIPGLLQEIVEAHGGQFIRCGFVGFGDSSINFELDFDILSSSFDDVFQARHTIGLAILQKFNEEGLEFAYPTQTTFTAAPDGRMIMPYPEKGLKVLPVKD